MYTVSSLLLIARCALLLSLLVVSRLIAPRLTDNALSETDYALESDDMPPLLEQSARVAALPPRHDFAAVVGLPLHLERQL
jgi:hypothetical protein